jgi:hypothetical protein
MEQTTKASVLSLLRLVSQSLNELKEGPPETQENKIKEMELGIWAIRSYLENDFEDLWRQEIERHAQTKAVLRIKEMALKSAINDLFLAGLEGGASRNKN